MILSNSFLAAKQQCSQTLYPIFPWESSHKYPEIPQTHLNVLIQALFLQNPWETMKTMTPHYLYILQKIVFSGIDTVIFGFIKPPRFNCLFMMLYQEKENLLHIQHLFSWICDSFEKVPFLPPSSLNLFTAYFDRHIGFRMP